jgi:two-component system sensor histidine kinase BaeS
MRVAHRLFLAVLPAVLGVLTVAALAYWGRRQYQVPDGLLVIAGVAAVGSLVVAWWNARYLARRIDGLAGRPDRRAPVTRVDELDAIEHSMGELEVSRAHLVAEAGLRLDAQNRTQEYARLVAAATDAAQRRIAEIRLPLHILLDNHFGELNENQEEMLAAAQDAANGAEEELRRIRRVLELDTEAIEARPELVRVVDLVSPLLPGVAARARAQGTTLHADISPALPHVWVDAQRTREALTLLLDEALGVTGDDSSLHVDAVEEHDHVRIEVSHPTGMIAPIRLAIPVRLFALQGIALTSSVGRSSFSLPAAARHPVHAT